jgi:hypothetical protein
MLAGLVDVLSALLPDHEIPPGTRHRLATPDGPAARVLCEFEPAGRLEYFMETVYRTTPRRSPSRPRGRR